MINILLAYDNADANIGGYFLKCAERTKEILDETNLKIELSELKRNSLNSIGLEFATERLNKKPFLFISYTHGSKNELLKNGTEPFISTTLNTSSLKKSFSYCFACHSGLELGEELCNQGTSCYIGYNDVVTVHEYAGFGLDDFVDCAITGIESFANGKNIKQVIFEMKKMYCEKIDKWYKKDMLIAGLFMGNRDALVAHGSLDMSILDFHVDKGS